LSDGATCERCRGAGRVEYSFKQGVCFDCNGRGKITGETEPNRPIYQRAGFRRATKDGRTEFYVFSEVFRYEIVKGFEVQWVVRLLTERDLLYRDSAGKAQWSPRLPGLGKTRIYRFKAEILGEEGDGDSAEC